MSKIAQSLCSAGAVRWLAVVALGALALVGTRASFAAGAPTDTITVTSPNNTTVAESDDYATQILGNPWDMNDADDTSFLGDLTPPTIAHFDLAIAG